LTQGEVTVDTKSGKVDAPGMGGQFTDECVPPHKYMVIKSQMVTFGYLDNFFLFDTFGQNLHLLDHRPSHHRDDNRFRWEGDQLIAYREVMAPGGTSEGVYILEYDLRQYSGSIRAQGKEAMELKDSFSETEWGDDEILFGDGEWILKRTWDTDRSYTGISIEREDGTCKTNLLSFPNAYINSILIQP